MNRTPSPPLSIILFASLASLFCASETSAADNLLGNPTAEFPPDSEWNLISSGGDGWSTRGESSDQLGGTFVTSYGWCTRSQTIDLLAAGFSESFLDRSPPLLAQESFKGFAPRDNADRYYIRVELRDAAGAVLDSWEVGSQANPIIADGSWQVQSHLFENYPAGVREIYWEDGGRDTENWAGHYGVMLDAAELSYIDPTPTEITLAPGTYPLSAPAGGVAGTLTAIDNPGATHTFELVSEIDTTTLINANSTWIYLDDGSDQGVAWIDPDFDDSAWSSGDSEFGYGDGDEVTITGGLNSHFTTYFRKSFNLTSGQLALLQGATLHLKRDDGAAVYLNGAEVARDNMPAGAIAFDTPAAGTAGDDGSSFNAFALSADSFQVGENVIAVEIHQASLTSSDTSFDLELIADLVGESYDNDLFTIDDDLLRFAQAASAVPVTIGATWTVNVRTTDDAGNTLTETLEVTGVANPTQPPTAISLDPAFVTEGLPAGTVVGDLLAADPDNGDYHTFELVSGAGDSDNTLFTVQSNRLVTAAVIDDSQATRNVRLRASDRGGMTHEQSLSIEVRAINNPPTDISFTGTSIELGVPTGTLVGTLSTEDLDTNETHTYEFVSTPGSESIFGFGELWRFLDDGSDLGGSNWTATGGDFDDGVWASGNGILGYGDAQNTIVSFGPDPDNKHITTYFRRTFAIADPSTYDEFVIDVMRDDGVAIYVNGTEVARDGLAPGAVSTDTATATIADAAETTPIQFVVPANLFVPGPNTIAAEVHQAAPGSSDLTFDLALGGAIDASGSRYFEIVNGNEVRTNAAFNNLPIQVGSDLDLVVRSTDGAGDSVVRNFSIRVLSDNPDDRDADGLPDAWETLHFGDIDAQDGDGDADNDGQTNLDEFRFGTLPNDGGSLLTLEIETLPGGVFRISWPSSTSRIYILQSTGSMVAGNWADSAVGPKVGNGGVMSEIVTNHPTGERQFRLVVELP